MNKYILSVMVLAGCSGVAFNIYSHKEATHKQSKKRENIEKILALTIDKDTISKSMQITMRQCVHPLLHAAFDKDGKQKTDQTASKKLKQVEKEINKFVGIYIEELLSKDSLAKIYDIYDANFNDKEIEDLAKFYESSVGRKMVTKMPEISTSIAQLSISILAKHIGGLQEKVTQIMKQEDKK